MKLDFNDKLVGGFNYEFVRGVSTASAGVAELGECVETMSRVRNGDFESWIEHWGATANRVSAFAQQQFDAGERGQSTNLDKLVQFNGLRDRQRSSEPSVRAYSRQTVKNC
jgi:hypothetical protein